MEFAVNKRLVEIHELKKFSWEELRLKLGVNKAQQISNWVNFKDKLPSRHIIKIIELFPDINARWFITGEGAMTENETLNITEDPKQLYNTCPLCKEKDKLITAHTDRIADLLRDRDKTEEEIARLKNQCAEKDELLDWYKGKKETAPDDSAQYRQAANE
jgi:hypothetical protein